MGHLGLQPSFQNGYAHSPEESEHPNLSDGLVLSVAPLFGVQGSTLHDLSGHNKTGSVLGGTWGLNKSGTVLSHTSISDRVSFGRSDKILPTQGITIIIGYEKRDAVFRQSAAFGVLKVTSSTLCGVFLPWSNGTVYWDFGGLDASHRLATSGLTFGDDVWAFTSGPRGMEVWQNGKLKNSNSSNPTRTSVSSIFQLGSSSSVSSDLANYSSFHVYNYQMPVSYIKDLSNDLLLPFRLRESSNLFAPSGGGGSAFNPAWAIGESSIIGGPVFA